MPNGRSRKRVAVYFCGLDCIKEILLAYGILSHDTLMLESNRKTEKFFKPFVQIRSFPNFAQSKKAIGLQQSAISLGLTELTADC